VKRKGAPPHAWSLLVFLFVITCLFVFNALARWENYERQLSINTVRSSMDSGTQVTNLHHLTHRLEEFEVYKVAECFKLESSATPRQVVYDTTSPDCIPDNHLSLPGTSKQSWELSFQEGTRLFDRKIYLAAAGILLFVLLMITHILKLTSRETEIRTKERLLSYARIGHDIQSPLLLLESRIGDDDLAKGAIKAIKEITQGTNNNTREIFCLKQSVMDSINSKNSEIGEPRIMLSIEGRYFPIYSNSDEFKRHLSNLLNNALEASPNSSSPIEVSAIKQGSHALIRIRDFGVGLPSSELRVIGNHAITNKKKGSGIGFLAAKQFFELRGGDISIKNMTPGAEVLIKVPLASTLAPQRVIHVEDDKYIAAAWKREVEIRDSLYIHFDCVEKFLAQGLIPDPHDLILLDLHLGASESTTFIQQISSAGYVTPWIVSGAPPPNAEIKGTKGFLAKKFPEALFKEVNSKHI
jgi:hypothetical protein